MSDTKKKILVIDDDQSILSIFEYILNEAGYETVTAVDGYNAIEKVKNNKFDLVFTDVKMPGLSGIDTYKEIRKLDPKLLVVMMTGYSVDELLKEAFELGAYGVIYKPFDMEEVLSIIEKIFNIPKTK